MLKKLNINVVLTQPFDGLEVSLPDRINLANNSNADLLISVHADANTNPDVNGYWAFYWHTREDSKRLAMIWNKHARENFPHLNRGTRASEPNHWTNFHMVRETRAPSILIEHAFMTNKDDLKLLLNENFRKLCAEVIVKTIVEYLGLSELEEDNMLKVNFLGKEIELEKVVVKDNFNHVSIRELFEKIGLEVDWKDGMVYISLK